MGVMKLLAYQLSVVILIRVLGLNFRHKLRWHNNSLPSHPQVNLIFPTYDHEVSLAFRWKPGVLVQYYQQTMTSRAVTLRTIHQPWFIQWNNFTLCLVICSIKLSMHEIPLAQSSAYWFDQQSYQLKNHTTHHWLIRSCDVPWRFIPSFVANEAIVL